MSTFVPSQYGSLMTMEKASVSPGVSPETAVQFDSLPCLPGVQPFVLRAVEHPLNYRRAPTIIINQHLQPEDKVRDMGECRAWIAPYRPYLTPPCPPCDGGHGVGANLIWSCVKPH